MKKIKCPKCNEKFELKELELANSDVMDNIKSSLNDQNKREVEEQHQKDLDKLKKEFESKINKKGKEIENELGDKNLELLKLQQELKAQKQLENEREELSKQKLKQQIEEARKEIEIELITENNKEKEEQQKKDVELLTLRIKLEEKEKYEEERKQLENERIERELKDQEIKLRAERDAEILKYKRNEELLKEKFDKMQEEKESQELIGEYGEEFIKNLLIRHFQQDELVDVKKGALGADLIFKIKEKGIEYGSILIEVKNTKHWENKWIAKFQNDLVKSGCDAGLLISKSQPKRGKKQYDFDMYNDNLMSCSFKEIIPIITLLRLRILQINKAKKGQSDLITEKDILFERVNSPEFKQRIQVIIERFSMMKDEYNKQAVWLQRSHKTQQEHIDILINQVVSLEAIVKTPMLSKPEITESDNVDIKEINTTDGGENDRS